MAVVTETIGTTGRDHSTITLWEANLDDDPTYDAADDAIGECYDDSAFEEVVVIDGGTTIGLNSVTLTVPSAERHDGTDGNGARIVASGSGILIKLVAGDSRVVKCKWLELDGNGNIINFIVQISNSGSELHNLIVHDKTFSGGTTRGIDANHSGANTPAVNILNTIVYDIESTRSGSGSVQGIYGSGGNRVCNILNDTVHNITMPNHTGGDGIVVAGSGAQQTTQNCISTDADNVCYSIVGTEDHNLASDTTASGTGSLDSKAAANQFVSTTGGSEDLHLKFGADAIDAGTDLGTTPSGVEIDIDDFDRDAGVVTWDMGAHEFIAVGGANPKGPLGHPFHGPFGGPV
jgi:hypothetical protein